MKGKTCQTFEVTMKSVKHLTREERIFDLDLKEIEWLRQTRFYI